jgi:pyrroloquinoline quinone biosynthesis protein D
MNSIENSSKPKRAFDVRFQSVRGRHLLVQRNQAFELDPVGVRIWELCDGTHTLQEMAGTIASEYDISSEQAQEDLVEFLQDLQNKGLIE